MNQQIFKQLFLKYYNPLCNFAYRIVPDFNKVEDIVQDVFLNFWKLNPDIDENKSIKSYLFSATKNRALEEIRKQNTSNKYMFEWVKDNKNEQNHSGEDEEWEDWVKIELIYSSLRHLPPKCKEVFELSKINGLTYTQIAERLNISPKTVENHMSKAFIILRKTLIKK